MRWLVVLVSLAAFVLVPFVLFEDYFNGLAARITAGEESAWFVAAAIGGLLASDCLLPVPSSILSTAAGAFLGLWRGTAVVWAGMMVSCVVGYFIGARSSGRTQKFVGDQGVQRARVLSDRYGQLAIVLCRPVPVLAEATVILAGVTHAPLAKFLVTCALSNLGVALGYAAIGAYSMSVDSFLIAFLLSMAIPGIGMWIARRRRGGAAAV